MGPLLTEKEGLIYLNLFRRPLLIQSWLHLPLLLIPIPTKKPESRHNELLLFSKCLHSLWGHLTLFSLPRMPPLLPFSAKSDHL